MSTRLVRVLINDAPTWGIIDEASDDVQIYHLEGSPYSTWSRGAALGALETLTLLPPAAPTKIVGVGRNYAAHAAEFNNPMPEAPLLFLKPPSSIVAHGGNIVVPPQSERVEHEAEVVIVMGKQCRNVTAEQAWDYVLGVTCGNDVTARDLQRKDGQWTRGKGFDTFCPLGPWLMTDVTAAEFADVTVTSRVNGAVRQQGHTADMTFTPADIIAYASAVMTLMPGDVLMTGTPSGVGPLVAGDVVEVEIGGVGVLRNPVI